MKKSTSLKIKKNKKIIFFIIFFLYFYKKMDKNIKKDSISKKINRNF